MSNRKHRMRMDEAGLKITEDFVLSHNGAGEILNEYRRLKTPLQLWLRNGLRQTEYEAGQRYGALWREVCQPKSPPYSDTTRIIVDGRGAPGEDAARMGGYRAPELADAQAEIRDEETITFLNRLCGMEDWPLGDKRRFKRKCRKGLEVLAVFWRKR
jgi:hypothetical protein